MGFFRIILRLNNVLLMAIVCRHELCSFVVVANHARVSYYAATFLLIVTKEFTTCCGVQERGVLRGWHWLSSKKRGAFRVLVSGPK
jgi:hypothetical protein